MDVWALGTDDEAREFFAFSMEEVDAFFRSRFRDFEKVKEGATAFGIYDGDTYVGYFHKVSSPYAQLPHDQIWFAEALGNGFDSRDCAVGYVNDGARFIEESTGTVVGGIEPVDPEDGYGEDWLRCFDLNGSTLGYLSKAFWALER